MVYLTYSSGPHKGRKRNVTKVDPEIVFHKILKFGWDWEIDYSEATNEEEADWWSYDLKSRIIRAITAGRCVYYMGIAYYANGLEEVAEVVLKVLEDINRSAYECGLESDNEYGVVIRALRSLN